VAIDGGQGRRRLVPCARVRVRVAWRGVARARGAAAGWLCACVWWPVACGVRGSRRIWGRIRMAGWAAGRAAGSRSVASPQLDACPPRQWRLPCQDRLEKRYPCGLTAPAAPSVRQPSPQATGAGGIPSFPIPSNNRSGSGQAWFLASCC
jgi:hypothetical protein